MKTTLLIVCLLSLSACAHGPKFRVTSSVPARIEKGGVTVCETTPCEINGDHWVGMGGSCRSGAQSELEAFPLDKNDGFTQYKKVWGDCGSQAGVFFDMKSTGGISTVPRGK